MNKTEVVRLRVTPELKAAIEKAAAADNRTVSSFIELAVKRQLKIK